MVLNTLRTELYQKSCCVMKVGEIFKVVSRLQIRQGSTLQDYPTLQGFTAHRTAIFYAKSPIGPDIYSRNPIRLFRTVRVRKIRGKVTIFSIFYYYFQDYFKNYYYFQRKVTIFSQRRTSWQNPTRPSTTLKPYRTRARTRLFYSKSIIGPNKTLENPIQLYSNYSLLSAYIRGY